MPPVLRIQTAPASCYGNRGGSFALWVLFSGAHAKPCKGSFGKPRVCGKSARQGSGLNLILGSPPRMRGKDFGNLCEVPFVRITPAYAGKRLKRSRSTVSPVAIVPLFPSVCNKPVVSDGSPAGRDAPLFLPAENTAPAPAGPAGSCPASRPSQFPPRITVISPRP